MLDLRLPFSVTDGKICYHADRRSEEERWLDDVSMEDDLFFSVVMDGNMALAELMLRTFISFRGKVSSVRTQSTFNWRKRKGVRFDCLAKDREGNLYDIEMQKKRDASVLERMWYYISLLTNSMLGKGEEYSRLKGKNAVTIFLLSWDVFKKGKPIYTFSVRGDEDFSPLGVGGLYVFVNLSYVGDDEKGRVIHDIRCKIPEEAYHAEFEEALRYWKREEGRSRMLDTLEMFQKKWKKEGIEQGIEQGRVQGIEQGREQGIEQGIERNRRETVRILLKNRRMTAEEISQDFNIPLEDVLEVAGRMMN